MNRILIAEDEPRIVSFLQKGLHAHGFQTETVSSGDDALALGTSGDFDLILLDLGLPHKDGLSVLADLRGRGSTVQVIVLTARNNLDDKVAGLELGADDYITKPFRFEELIARVRARLRNRSTRVGATETHLSARNIQLDLRARKVRVGDREIELSAREFLLAETFLRSPDRALSRAQLLDRVWGYDYDPGSNIVDVYVGYLRKKLGSDAIETVRGVGYRFVTRIEARDLPQTSTRPCQS